MDFFLGLIALLATTVGAVSGIGGGVLIKPVLDAVSGLPVAEISFLSGCTVLAMSMVALLRSATEDTRVELRRGTLLAVGGAVGGLAGKQLFDFVLTAAGNASVVGMVQNVVMVLLTLGVLGYVVAKKRIQTLAVQRAALCLLIGVSLGVLSAFLGIGGGPINLVVLSYFFSMDTKTAALSSLYIIFFSQTASLASTFFAGRVPAVAPVTLMVMVLCGIAGGLLGRALNRKMSGVQVDALFRVLLVVITAISAYNVCAIWWSVST